MPVNPIVFKVTDAGRDAAAYAFNNLPGGKLSLTAIKLGLAKYSPVGNETVLQSPLPNTFSIGGGGVQVGSGQIRFTPILASLTRIEAFEIGLFTDTGILFAVAATPTNNPLLVIEPDIEAIFSMNVALANVDPNSIQIVVDVNAPLAVVMMGQHIAASHPHSQYKRTNDASERLKIADGQSNDEAVSKGQLDAEATTRAGVDSALAGQIAQEALDRQAADTTEATARENQDLALSIALAAEITNRINGDLAVLGRLNSVVFTGNQNTIYYGLGHTFTLATNKTIKVILIGAGGGSGGSGGGGSGFGNSGAVGGDSLIYPSDNPAAFIVKAFGGLAGGGAYGGNGSSFALGSNAAGREVEINNLYDVAILSYQDGLTGNLNEDTPVIRHPTVKMLGLTLSGRGAKGTYGGGTAISGAASGGAFVEALITNRGNTPLALTIDCGIGGLAGTGNESNGIDGNDGVCVVIHD